MRLSECKTGNGIDYFLDLTGFDKAMEQSDLVITGEGSIDEQTLQGKGPFGVAFHAKSKNIPVIGIAGNVPVKKTKELDKGFNALFAIGQGPDDIQSAIKLTRDNLMRTSTEIGNLLAIGLKR